MKGNPVHCQWEREVVQLLRKAAWKSPPKMKTIAIMWPSDPISGCTSKGDEIGVLKRRLYPHVHDSIMPSSQDMETTYVSVKEWMGRMWPIDTQQNITQLWKGHPAIGDNMAETGGRYAKRSKPDKDKYWDLTYVWNPKKVNHRRREWWLPVVGVGEMERCWSEVWFSLLELLLDGHWVFLP